jgi:hypothetical protein
MRIEVALDQPSLVAGFATVKFRRQVSNFIQTQNRYRPKLIDTGRAPSPPILQRARGPRNSGPFSSEDLAAPQLLEPSLCLRIVGMGERPAEGQPGPLRSP